jgi:hypothetical protein
MYQLGYQLPKPPIWLLTPFLPLIVATSTWGDGLISGKQNGSEPLRKPVTIKDGATYLWFGIPDNMLLGAKVSQVWVSRRKQLLILDTNSMLPPQMRKPERVRVYLSVDPNDSAAGETP